MDEALVGVAECPGGFNVALRSGASLETDLVLSAIGREPATHDLCLETAGFFARSPLAIGARFELGTGGRLAVLVERGGDLALPFVAESKRQERSCRWVEQEAFG